ncbi:MAG: Flp pilus assembly complex ATPase component TadA [Desulfovibrio sp.]|nr:Flp pilus assembly complex ATPase component TadA [Desulfovibrio sp.]
MAYADFCEPEADLEDLWSLSAKEQEEALRTLLRPFSGKVFVHPKQRELHLSRDLGRDGRIGELLFWGHSEGLRIIWHDPLEFAEHFSRASTQIRLQDNAIQRYVVELFETAYARRAQDIHIIHSGRSTLIRLRILGDLIDYEQKDPIFGEQMMALIYNCFAQQTGRAVFSHLLRLDGRIINPQVLPAGVFAVRLHAEPIQSNARDAGLLMTLRLLYDSTHASGSLRQRLSLLGFLPEQIAQIGELVRRDGLSLVSGATGHGKSTVLKHIFESMVASMPERSYLSVEDPPEYRILGVNQIQVQTEPGEGLNRAEAYREALAGALRSDPDVLMIGEIRYAEAAQAAINCALSGHAVWATLHAENSLACVTRLEGLLEERGQNHARQWILNPDVLSGLCHLRLLPVLCQECKQKASDRLGKRQAQSFSQDSLLRAKKVLGRHFGKVYVRGPGCSHCQGRGTVAMTLAAEVVTLDNTLRELLIYGQMSKVRDLLRKNGGKTSVEVALQKMAEGLVDPRDVEMRLNAQIPC